MNIIRFMAAMVAVGFCTASADACNRCGLLGNRCVFHKQAIVQQVVTPQVYYGAPQISYFVGQEVRIDAAIQQALRTDPDYQAFQKFRQWQAMTQPNTSQGANGAGLHPGAGAERATEAPAPLSTTLAAKCAACHSGATPKAGLIIDGTTPLTCEQALHAMRKITSGEMPPKVPLSPDEAGAAFSELLELSKPEGDE